MKTKIEVDLVPPITQEVVLHLDMETARTLASVLGALSTGQNLEFGRLYVRLHSMVGDSNEWQLATHGSGVTPKVVRR